MSEVLKDKGNIGKLAAWTIKDVVKEEGEEMTRVGVSKGLGKQKVSEAITRISKEHILARQGV